MKKADCYELGVIAKAHGLAGEVILFLDVDDPEAYLDLASILVEAKNQLVPYFVESFHLVKEGAIVKLEEIDTVEQARGLAGKKVYLPLTMLPKLDEGQFYYHEIIGYTVTDERAGQLGQIFDVYDTNAQALMALRYKGNEVLIPVTDAFLKQVDHGQKNIRVALPDGFLEVYTSPFSNEEEE